ncbi:hypothetical protein GCM10027347_61190 [Larkinella harenae]
MNTPNYILIDNNRAAVDMRLYLPSIGISDESYRGWMAHRIKELDLVDGHNFLIYKEHGIKGHVVTLPTLKEMHLIGRGDNLRELRAEIKGLSAQLVEAGVELIETLQDFDMKAAMVPIPLPLVGTEEVSEQKHGLLIHTDGPVPILQIGGRAAVYAHDLFELWAKGGKMLLTDWMRNRVSKHDLLIGKNYVEYKDAVPGKSRKTTFYILSVEAAILIARGEVKGKGKPLAEYLIGFQKKMKAERLSTKGALSDFIHAGLPIVAAITTPDAVIGTTPNWFDYEETQPQERATSPTREVVEASSVLAPSEPEPESTTESMDVPPISEQTTSEAGSDEQAGSTPNNTEPQEQPWEFGSTTVVLNIFDLLVEMTQNNLAMASSIHLAAVKMSDMYKQQGVTAETISALVGIEQEAARAKMGLRRGTAPIPTATIRDNIRHLVNKRVNHSKESYSDLFSWIYRKLRYVYNIDISKYEKLNSEETHLQLCERIGVLDQVLQIVQSPQFNDYAQAKQAA